MAGFQEVALRAAMYSVWRLRVPEIGGVEAFGEPAVDWGEEVTPLGALDPIAPEAREAGSGAQLQRFRLLAA
jgi:hypothetical protein